MHAHIFVRRRWDQWKNNNNEMLFVLFRTKARGENQTHYPNETNAPMFAIKTRSKSVTIIQFFFCHSLSLSFLLFFIHTIYHCLGNVAVLIFFHALRIPAFCFIRFFSKVRWMDFVFRVQCTLSFYFHSHLGLSRCRL